MPKPLTHQERSKRAAAAVMEAEREWWPSIVAEQTLPTELVEATRFVIDKCALYGPADQAREKIRAALALYEEEAANE